MSLRFKNHLPQVLSHQADLQTLFAKPVALHGVVVTPMQDLAIFLIEPQASNPACQIPLQRLFAIQQLNTHTQFSVLCKLTEEPFNPLVHIDKDVKQDWPQHEEHHL